MTRCLQQVRVIIIPSSSSSSSSDPPEQHAWPPVRLEAAAAVVDDHVAMMAEDPNTRNEVPTGAGIQCRWTRTTTQRSIIGNGMMGTMMMMMDVHTTLPPPPPLPRVRNRLLLSWVRGA